MSIIKPAKYEMFARVAPALVTTLPSFFLYHFYINKEIVELTHSVLDLKIIDELPIATAIIIIFYNLNRLLGKQIEMLYFKSKNNFPTTDKLMYKNNDYSIQYKNKIREKIKNDFNINLLNPEEEQLDISQARKLVIESVNMIIERIKDGRLVLSRSLEYGLFRNLIGGGLIALPVSLFGVYFFSTIYISPLALKIEVFSAIFFFMLILFSYRILRNLGNDYADTLFREYLRS